MDTRIEPAAFAAKYLCNEPSSNIANHIEVTPIANHLCVTRCVKRKFERDRAVLCLPQLLDATLLFAAYSAAPLILGLG